MEQEGRPAMRREALSTSGRGWRPDALAWAVVAVALVVGPAQAEESAARRLARQIGLSEAAIERVAAGEVVVEELEPSSDKELGLALVAVVDATIQEVSDAVDADAFVGVSEITLARGEIDTESFSLADLALPDDLVRRLAEDPEGTFFLSRAEAARVEGAAKQGKDAALETYRKVLSDRARAYWEKGDEGILPYAEKGRSPHEDLAAASQASREVIPGEALQALLINAASKASGPVEHRLEWRVQKGRDQAAPVLSHAIRRETDKALLFIDRRFYSGYDYDALLALLGVLPTSQGDRSVVFYINRTYTAQVAGFGGGAKRSIGRKLMKKELVAEMERLQKVAAGL
jgi:hypothetical protein